VAIADLMNLRVVSVRPDETVQIAVARMLEENVGAVAVCEAERLVGIFTERDVLRLTGEGTTLSDVKVGAVMTRALVTVSPDDDVLAAAELMGAKQIRHLPVLQGENLLGIVGIRDVLRMLVERLWRDHDPGAREMARELLRRAPGVHSEAQDG
jgi:CBS domain-containing protein